MILTDESLMPFGKYKGTAMANVDADYLLWLWNSQGSSKPFGEATQAVINYIAENLDAIKHEARTS